MLKHRNSQKRIFVEDCVYFVTSKTFGNYPYFKEGIFCDLFVENLRLCKQLKEFDLYAWFLGYDHFHLLVKPKGEFGLSEVIHFLKRHVSRNINIIMEYTQYKPLPEGDVGQRRLRNDERLIIQQFDDHVLKLTSKFLQKHEINNDIPIFQWQKSYHDHYIRNENDFNYHYNYILRNPQKHKLPNEWEYISINKKYENLINNNL